MSRYLLLLLLSIVLSIQVCCAIRQPNLETYKRRAYGSTVKIGMDFKVLDAKTKTAKFGSITATAFALDSRYLATAGHFCVAAVDMSLTALETSSTIIYVDKDEELNSVSDFKIVAIDVKNDLCILDKPSHRTNTSNVGV